MKTTILCLAVFSVVSAFCSAQAALTTTESDMTVAGDWAISVAAGSTNRVTAAQTGTGKIVKTGLGVLVLANGGNTFSGGIAVDEGIVVAAAEGSLGSGTVSIAGNNTRGQTTQLCFDAADATFDNNIYVTSGGADVNPVVLFLQNTTLNGAITNALYTVDAAKVYPYYAAHTAGTRIVFNGPIYTPTVTSAGPFGISVNNSTMAFYGPIDVYRFNPGRNNATGVVELHAAEHRWSVIMLGYPKLFCYGENVLVTNKNLTWTNVSVGNTTRGLYDLNGYNQTVGGLSWNSSNRPRRVDGWGVVNSSETPATLTVGLTGDCTAYAKLDGNLSFVLNATKSTLTQSLATNRVNSMTGDLIVSNGILRADYCSFTNVQKVYVAPTGSLVLVPCAEAFVGLKTLTVEGTLTLSDAADAANPFGEGTVDLVLGPNAKLSLPDGIEPRFHSVTIDGTPLPAGGNVYSAGSPEQLAAGAFRVGTADVTWTGGAGVEDESVQNTDNWSGAVNVADTFYATFASGGTNAIFDAEIALHKLTFTAAGDFTLAKGDDSSLIKVGEGGIAAEAVAGNPERKYTVEPDVELVNEEATTWEIATNATVLLKGNLHGDAEVPLIQQGEGTLVLAGSNTLAGAVYISNGICRLSGYLGPRDSGILCVQARTSPSTNVRSLGRILWDGVVLDKAFEAEADNMFAHSSSWFTGVAGTTNVFNDYVDILRTVYANPRGGRWIFNGPVILRDKVILYGGVYDFCGIPTAKRNYSLSVNTFANLSGAAIVNCYQPRTRFVNVYGGSSSQLHLWCDYALDVAAGYTDVNCTNMVVDLHGTRQSIRALTGKNGKVMGGAGSRLEVRYGTMAGDIADEVSLVMAGDNAERLLLLRARNFTTTGDLVVTNGTLEIAADATWTNGVAVMASHTGVLKINSSTAFNPQTCILRLTEEGVIEVPAGVVQRVSELWLDGDTRRRPAGLYGAPGNANATYTTPHITGGGLIKATTSGTAILFR